MSDLIEIKAKLKQLSKNNEKLKETRSNALSFLFVGISTVITLAFFVSGHWLLALLSFLFIPRLCFSITSYSRMEVDFSIISRNPYQLLKQNGFKQELENAVCVLKLYSIIRMQLIELKSLIRDSQVIIDSDTAINLIGCEPHIPEKAKSLIYCSYKDNC